MSRPWLAFVLVLFCLPLFFGLRSLDLETDEAIYSFSVDRILEVGEWLQPKSSPSETAVFLEKPPLKFWIVAAPIKLGLLPHDEFGLRFWDALFGGVAFVYVFAIGSILAGPVCGAAAVLLLFVHEPLLLDHGLRTNNMEGALFLCYCGGVYHGMSWARAGERRGRWHAAGAGLYFVLGFMTKFVAAIFLPAVVGAGVLLFSRTRQKLAADWRLWLAVAGLVLALSAPWFIYAQVQFGELVWHTMLAEHVYARFTTSLNPAHIHPWNYYLLQFWQELTRSGVAWIVPLGVVVLLVQTIRRRWFEGAVVVVWAVVPLALISMGSSKLYHYAYPFLPPLTIAAGYVVALVMMLAPVVLRRVLTAIEDAAARALPALSAVAGKPWVSAVGTVVIYLAAAMILGTLLFGPLRLGIGRTTLLKSSGILRPLAAIVVAGLIARRSAFIAPLVVALTLAWWIPVPLYKDTVSQLLVERHPLRDASDCVHRVEEGLSQPPGLYVDTDSSMWHPIYYYFRRLQPWTRQTEPSADNLARHLYDPASPSASLVQEQRYRDYLSGPDAARITHGASLPLIALFEYQLLLPGPYAVCSPEAALLESR